ncbi:MAG: hypothetical protein LBB34_00055 [Holosporales bacterium]|jgi:hypothetical protein|nr:hypothetical protein [Holosporales bacterium]
MNSSKKVLICLVGLLLVESNFNLSSAAEEPKSPLGDSPLFELSDAPSLILNGKLDDLSLIPGGEEEEEEEERPFTRQSQSSVFKTRMWPVRTFSGDKNEKQKTPPSRTESTSGGSARLPLSGTVVNADDTLRDRGLALDKLGLFLKKVHDGPQRQGRDAFVDIVHGGHPKQQ